MAYMFVLLHVPLFLTADCLMSLIFFLFGKYLHLNFYRVLYWKLLKALNINLNVIFKLYML